MAMRTNCRISRNRFHRNWLHLAVVRQRMRRIGLNPFLTISQSGVSKENAKLAKQRRRGVLTILSESKLRYRSWLGTIVKGDKTYAIN
jgi:hypothetical protein